MEVIKKVENSWDKEKKQALVHLGNSNKPYGEILTYLENEIHLSKRMTAFDHKINCFRNDGIYQLHRAIEDTIGATNVRDKEVGPSGGSTAVETITVTLADGTIKKVPYGKINLPDMGEDAHIEIRYSDAGKYLRITGECQFKFQTLIDTIMAKTNHLLNTDSIYKNQSIEINANVDKGQPVVMNLSNIDKETMIVPKSVEIAMIPLTARISNPEKCIANKIPIKFGALLEGPYGTGKTLLAFKLANQATANNWSFIYLKSPELLADTLRMAKTLDKNGHGIIVFTEDIDQVTRGERTSALQDILNTLDGGDTKNMNVIALFTTNHLELIEPTFLRGKRIGTIISMPYLDAESAKQYTETFCKEVDLQGDFAPVYELVAQSNIAPAFMAEIVENVKSNMILSDTNVITADHFLVCIKSYLRQVSLSQTKDTSLTKEVVLANALRDNILTEEYYERIAAITEDQLNK